jgi:DNA-directed RNA polymerase II subunit RPB1
MDASLRSQDDLTHKLSEIVKTNNLIKKQQESSDPASAKTLCDLLQYHVTTYIDNGIPGINQATQRTGRPIKAICQRLKSKEGRVRGNLMGKRVNFSARTVITAEPNIDLDELGVPFEISKILTYPERVTNLNIKKLQEYVNNGYNPLFGKTGAKLVHQNGIQKDIRFVKNLELSIGDTVERHLIDGDFVIFNRQPSLHKMSMMGHKIKIMPHSTFRMNVCATTPYNADYDGDEMNIHVPQTEITKAEVQELMNVSSNIVSPQSNKPVIGIIQDALLGCHKITKDDVFIDEIAMCNIIMSLKNKKIYSKPNYIILKPKKLYSGKQVFELILPNDFMFTRYINNNNTVIIKNGKLVQGTLCKRSLGTSEGGIIHLLWLQYGPYVANEFISNVQYIVNCWLITQGFSIGAMDMFIDSSTESKVNDIISNAKNKVSQILEVANKNKHVDFSSFENKINQTLNNAMSQSGLTVQDNIPISNNINTSVTGGSKGSMFNIAQIMGCVGQQNVGGKRLDFGYVDRVLCHFERCDNGPEAKGFVEHSYKTGLDPHEFFYHAMGGREGIIDTAIKTSETGYIQRRLVKAMEDLKVNTDRTVRNSIGDIVQFNYGDDGLDASFLITEHISLINDFHWDNMPNDEINILKESINILKQVEKQRSPLMIQLMCQKIEHNTVYVHNNLSSELVFAKINELCENIEKCQLTYLFATRVVTSLIRICFCTKFLCNKSHTLLDIEKYCETLYINYNKSLIQSGEMVGVIAAQSLGEPVTQLTLNTFHAAGISAKNVTLGVPRFKELINAAKNLKSPSLRMGTKNITSDHDLDKYATIIENLNLNMIVKNSCIFKIDFTNDYFKIPDEFNDYDFFEYGIRYYIDNKLFSSKRLSILDITSNIMKEYDSIYCIGTSDFADEIYIEIYIHNDEELSFDSVKILNSQLITQNINGINSICKVYTDSKNGVLDIEGTNILNLLNFDWCNFNETWSNDINEMKIVFGIEAARELLLKEIKHVLEFDGTYINERHFQILVDVMTYKGGIMSITRHGINRSENGPLMKCSFEETVDVLCDAAVFGDFDGIKGVTESITVGKIANMGTGMFDLYYSPDDTIQQNYDTDEEENDVENDYTIESICSDDQYLNSYFDDSEIVQSFFDT